MKPSRWIAVALAVTAGPASADTGGTFRDWSVLCSVGLDCTTSVNAPKSSAISALAFRRRVDANAPLMLELFQGGDKRLIGPVTFAVDDGSPLKLPADSFSPQDDGLISSGAQVEAMLLPLLRDGRSVTVRVQTESGPAETVFSLSGLVAALRKIDDDQQRIGTASALIDKGTAPLPDRASLPADIVSADGLPDSVRKIWEDGPGDCADFGDVPPEVIGFSLPLANGQKFFGLQCGMPGAYNYPSRFYLQSDDTADIVPVPGISQDGPTATLDAWNIDVQDRTISSFFKGRGIGDCGNYSVWRIDDQSGGLVLTEAREKDDCDGKDDGGPDSWPLLWPISPSSSQTR